jgi:hypothetical protein
MGTKTNAPQSKVAVAKPEDLQKSASYELPGNSQASVSGAPGDGQGFRYDATKLARYDLIPPEALEALAIFYGQAGGPVGGPALYPERNWERGMAWCRCFTSLMRHAWKWLRKEDFDQKTGAHHMIAVAWNALALYTYYVREIGDDNRPGGTLPVPLE